MTAGLRYADVWQSARDFVRANGQDPAQCLILDCDQGGSLLMQPDGGLVIFDVYGNGSNWEPVEFVQVDRHFGPQIDFAWTVLGSEQFEAKIRSIGASDT